MGTFPFPPRGRPRISTTLTSSSTVSAADHRIIRSCILPFMSDHAHAERWERQLLAAARDREAARQALTAATERLEAVIVEASRDHLQTEIAKVLGTTQATVSRHIQSYQRRLSDLEGD